MPDWGPGLIVLGNVLYCYVWMCNVADRRRWGF